MRDYFYIPAEEQEAIKREYIQGLSLTALSNKYKRHRCALSKLVNDAGIKRFQESSVKRKCKICGKQVSINYARRTSFSFCSYKCAGQWRKKNFRGENNPRFIGPINFKCKQCGKQLSLERSRNIYRIYCSHSCRSKWVNSHKPPMKGKKHSQATLSRKELRIKGKAANEYCNKNSMNYVVWTESCLHMYRKGNA